MGFFKYAGLIVLTAVAVKVLPSLWEEDLPLHFGGGVLDSRFRLIERVFKRNFENGWDEREGAAFAVYYQGKLVVDLWGGYADKSAHREWKEDTISVVFSSTKAVCALCAGMLIDRGLLDTEALVTKYWPEFGQHGKHNVTVEMLLSHQAGLAALDSHISKADVFDSKQLSKKFEDQVPNWPPGTANGYHALTFGWLVDQLIRRVDTNKRSIGQFFREEIGEPHNVDFFLGLPKGEFHRVARLTPPSMLDYARYLTSIGGLYAAYKMRTAESGLFQRVIANPTWMFGKGTNAFNDPEVMSMEIGGGGGIASARGLAKTFSLLGEGKLIKNRKVMERLSQPVRVKSLDKLLNVPLTMGHGFMYSRSPEGEYLIGHPGYGGQNVKLDRKHQLAFAYITNALKPGMGDLTRTMMRLQLATYESIGIKPK